MAAPKSPDAKASGADADAKPKTSYADAEAEHARALALRDAEAATQLSQAESAVTKLNASMPREREAFIAAHCAEQGARRGALARRWIPKFAALATAWSASPSRETTRAMMSAVTEYVQDATHSCGSAEPFLLGVGFAESVIARHPASIAVWCQFAAWTESGGYSGSRTLSTLTSKAFEELRNPFAFVEAGRALEDLEAQFVALMAAPYVSRIGDIEEANARWEYFKTGESLHAINDRLTGPQYRRLQLAAQAAATENRRWLITKARGGDADARYQLGEGEWLAARHLDPETYGPLVP